MKTHLQFNQQQFSQQIAAGNNNNNNANKKVSSHAKSASFCGNSQQLSVSMHQQPLQSGIHNQIKTSTNKNNTSNNKVLSVLSQGNTPETQKYKGKNHQKQSSFGKHDENQNHLVLDLQRKKSIDSHSHMLNKPQNSQSVRVSPVRQASNTITYRHKPQNTSQQEQLGNPYSLRIPLSDQEKVLRLNKDFANVSHISQTQVARSKQIQHQDIASNGYGINEQMELTYDQSNTSMHQSFVNLIYPSMAKKIMTNNVDKYQQLQKQSKPVFHHQKSKSLFVGSEHIAQNHPQAPPQAGVQKVNQSSYKKQANVFNYSQRLKELLNDSNEDHQQQETHKPQKHQLFSQQPSPVNSKPLHHVTYDMLHKPKDPSKPQLNKSTFDKPQSSNSFLTLGEHIHSFAPAPQQISQTIDIQQNSKNVYQKQANTSQCTPISQSFANMQQSKAKIGQSSKTHLRKPSHQGVLMGGQVMMSMNNNFINENTNSFINETNNRLSMKRDSMSSNSNQVDQNNNQHFRPPQFQNHHPQPVREKKQHQPSQGKIQQHKQQVAQNLQSQSFIQGQQQQSNLPQKNHYHQRSQSDYISYQHLQQLQQNQQQINSKQQLNKLLNSDSDNDNQSFENNNHHKQQTYRPQIDFYEHNQIQKMNQDNQGVTPKTLINNASIDKSNASFLQQYSQALIDAQIQINKQYYQNNTNGKQTNTKELNKQQVKNMKNLQKNSFIIESQQNINNLTLTANSTDKPSIYHQRKLSYQPQSQTLQTKKSPQKPQFISKDNQKKLASKNKPSPKANLNHQYQLQMTNSQKPQVQANLKYLVNSQSTNLSKQSSVAQSLKTSAVTSPLSNSTSNYYKVQNNLSIQHNYLQNSLCQSMGETQKNCSQTQNLSQNMKKSENNYSIKDTIIQQATKKYQDQLLKKQGPQKSQSFVGIKKSNQSQKVSPKIKTVQPNKKIANVSIDLYNGSLQQQNPQGYQQYQQAIKQTQDYLKKQSSKNSLQRSSLGPSDSQSLSGSMMLRKNSFVQQQVQNTYRQQSPMNTLLQNQTRSNVTLNSYDISKTSKQVVQSKQNQMMFPRYSVQHSPQKPQSLFQKSQKSSLHMKTNSASNIQLNFNPQQINGNNYHNKSTVVSPNTGNHHNRSSSFTYIQNSLNANKSTISENHIQLNNFIDSQKTQKQQNQQKQQPLKQAIIANVRYDQTTKLQNTQIQQQQQQNTNNYTAANSLSETEMLLNQIRSNIMSQKYGQKESSTKEYTPMGNDLKSQKLLNNNYLCKITEASVEQFPIDTNLDFLHKSAKKSTLKKQLTLDEGQSNFLYQTTDPCMSPNSKDLFKLQKMIKFNFKKFNEPPVTTSEFYRIGRVLGRGAFGKVNLAAHKISEQLVAIKSINKEFLKSEEDQRKKIMQEFAILKQSNHKSVVRLYDSFETNKHICFVMELCSGGDLLTYVRKRRKLKEDVAKYFFKQIIEGLAYIHNSKLIVHRDIKLDNILLDANGRIKICDFGVSRQVSSENERMTEQCGTPAYIAPEILRDKGYEGFKVDVWSAGVCLYAMLVGTVPFKAAGMHELHHLIINGKYDLKEEKLSESAENLIKALLEVDHRKRLSACEVLNHPWLKDAQDEMDIFTQKEKDTIQKEYLSKNIDKVIGNRNTNGGGVLNNSQQNFNAIQDTDVIFTEHNLDTKTNNNSLMKNASTKSIILAPFNSTISDFDEKEKEGQLHQWPEEIKRMIVHKRVIKYSLKCKDLDRQYEQNNNADLDNGVYNNFANDENSNKTSSSQRSRSSESSNDSLKRSFKETELSSDDEKAEKQVEENRKQKMMQQSELQEFEKQIKMKYVKYQEPQEIVNTEIIEQITCTGLYPKEYLLKCLNNKDMNYASATYHLLLKKKQIIQKLFSEELNAQPNSQE